VVSNKGKWNQHYGVSSGEVVTGTMRDVLNDELIQKRRRTWMRGVGAAFYLGVMLDVKTTLVLMDKITVGLA
jgi:hypothetical protein